MGEAVLHVLLYALIAAASPLALASTLVVLKSHRARLNGVIFAAAFLLGEIVDFLLLLAIGSLVPERSRDTVASVLELAFGALLLAAGWRVQRSPASQEAGMNKRTQAVLARLARLTPTTAFWVGIALGIGVPKRLTITIVAAATISAAAITTQEKLVLVALYIVVASVLVWVPVSIYLVAGKRASAWLGSVEAWLTANQRLIAVVSLLFFGFVLVSDALRQLL